MVWLAFWKISEFPEVTICTQIIDFRVSSLNLQEITAWLFERIYCTDCLGYKSTKSTKKQWNQEEETREHMYCYTMGNAQNQKYDFEDSWK